MFWDKIKNFVDKEIEILECYLLYNKDIFKL